jgi:hypothetical protein
MAKPKPSLQGGVIRHEIVLGKVEREMAESLSMSKTVDNLVRPVALVGAVGVLGLTSYAIYKGAKAYFEWGADVIDDVTGIVSLNNAAKIVSETENLTKEEAAEKYTRDELNAKANEISSSKAKAAKSPALRFGGWVNGLFS